MEKNILKWYEAPQVEVVEMELSVSLLAGSDGVGGDSNGGVTTPPITDSGDEGWD